MRQIAARHFVAPSLVDIPLGQSLLTVSAINDAGQVIALAIPEPETYVLLLAGLGLVGVMAGRRKPA